MAVCALMLFFAASSITMFLDRHYELVCFVLGLELILFWVYLNPWIMQIEYTMPLFLDYDRMRYNAFVISGLVVVAGSAVLMAW
jgi:hypothetical protein